MTYKKKTLKKLQSKWNRLPPNKEATALANIEWAVCHKCLEVSTWTQEQIQAQETVIRFSQDLIWTRCSSRVLEKVRMSSKYMNTKTFKKFLRTSLTNVW